MKKSRLYQAIILSTCLPEKKVVQKSGIVSDTKGLTTIRIATLVEKMKYDINEFTVKPGKKVKLLFANPDFMPHNLVFTKPNKADSVAQQALTLGAQGFAMAFVPKSEDVLWASQLVDHGKEEEMNFTAPTEKGDYPYVCTFPGHHILMRGVMKVR